MDGLILGVGIPLVWLIGVMVTAPRILRWYMLRTLCSKCHHRACTEEYCRCKCYDHARIPRGEYRERDRNDGWRAFAGAAFWPLIVFGLLVKYIALGIDTVVGGGVINTKLTEPEQRRVMKEQEQEIKRRQREIENLTKDIHAATDPQED